MDTTTQVEVSYQNKYAQTKAERTDGGGTKGSNFDNPEINGKTNLILEIGKIGLERVKF